MNPFTLFMKSIAHLEINQMKALVLFYKWLVSQKGIKREYIYEDMFVEQTDTFTLVDVVVKDDELYVYLKIGKYGKKVWQQHLHDCVFKSHWMLKNRKAKSKAYLALK